MAIRPGQLTCLSDQRLFGVLAPDIFSSWPQCLNGFYTLAPTGMAESGWPAHRLGVLQTVIGDGQSSSMLVDELS